MSAKRRFFGTLVIWCIFSLGSIWFAKEIFGEYFAFGMNITFSPFASALIMLPVVLLFPCIYWFMAMRHGEKMAVLRCKNIYRGFIGLIGVFFIGAIAFTFAYTSVLEGKGYQKCTQRPDGWMPGMATEYVLPPMTCGMLND
ncbi:MULTISPECIES: hypothetical protein [Citrobacter]|uniref:DUF1240 domain-containing protein n=1 Tax=Citrobacter pasteurii TaxID=1563222 RepID=A0ABX8KCA5_9ENTR|nr:MULTISPECIES: hypothetical protein [Citrobacter]QXA46467.1 hypothetical protein I6L54_08845 [Citrobacter pasteurii]TKU53051.1 hypothetical protein FDX05_23225 [Citrobacter sp. wls715]HEF0060531.1 hypothetical protein [Citrobacter pasteurii]